MSKHIHADLMLQYAQDAMTTDKPWLLWEFYDGYDYDIPKREEDRWHTCLANFGFCSNGKYRRKPETFKINGFDVPEPVRQQLKDGQVYYTITMTNSDPISDAYWDGCPFDLRALKRGVIHLTREAAELHAKALLSFTEAK